MKKIFTLLALIVLTTINAQAPQGFNYQATVRNSSGALIVNQNVLFKFNIMLNSQTSLPVYSETHQAPTDDLGQVNLTIGSGTPTVGTFSNINWGGGSYFLGIELNTGTGYVAMGTTQLLSVPYALYSGNSCATCLPTIANIGDVLSWNGSSWVSTPASNLISATVTTIAATSVTSNSAISGGTISNDGGNTIIAKGVCWSSSINPTINDFYTNNGSGANNFTSTISNLTPGANYYYRAYITNSSGTFYGSTYTLSIPAILPTVTTNLVTNITYNTAISGGNVTSDGGAIITARGVCWCTCPAPTINDSHTTDGSGLGSFVSQLSNLGSNYDIYVRAYATNSQGTSYGETIYFITPPALPIVTTNTVTQITSNTAVCGGAIEGFSASARGVCWSTSPNPTIALSTKTVNGSGIGFFNSTITGLTASTIYYVRAYGTNSAGTAYGDEISFTTLQDPTVINVTGPNISDIDGNTYQSVTNCGLTFTKQNLNVSKYSDGTPIPQVTDPTQWQNLTTGAWCYYNNTTANGTIYGKLYNWYAVAGIYDAASANNPALRKKLAPTGWHVPTDAEWTQLTDCLGGESVAGGKMKETGTTHWNPNIAATNESGFTGLPGGVRNSFGSFEGIFANGTWWSFSENDATNAWYRSLDRNYGNAGRSYSNKIPGFSVRCIKD